MRSEMVLAETVQITGFEGDAIEAYSARCLSDRPRGGVVVIHHMPGYDRATKEIARRFAEMGYNAICPNLHYREAPGAEPDDAAAASRAAGGVPDGRLVGDVAGARRYLLSLSNSNGKVGVIGYCSGGRQSFLAACSLEFDAAVDCYGAFIVNQPAADHPLHNVKPIIDLAPNLSCELLGLFGADDKYPAPAEVEELSKVLKENGKAHRFHTFEGAGHAFFATDRPSYRVEAANQGWSLITGFFSEKLA
ncbi:MAG: dienelactone hydrolase family protein [Actinomycetota bacterium]|nr:dienelactone hydrolase family protein [Actinomycetota bacterium]